MIDDGVGWTSWMSWCGYSFGAVLSEVVAREVE